MDFARLWWSWQRMFGTAITFFVAGVYLGNTVNGFACLVASIAYSVASVFYAERREQ